MHKGLSQSSKRGGASTSTGLLRRDRLRKALIFVALAAFLLLALAWIDGGEEPIHAIRQPVALPQAGEVS